MKAIAMKTKPCIQATIIDQHIERDFNMPADNHGKPLQWKVE
jgi:hypothetical protein